MDRWMVSLSRCVFSWPLPCQRAFCIHLDPCMLFVPVGGFRVCQEDRLWEEDVDLLRNAGIRSARDHPEQRPRHLSRLLVPGDPDVRAADRQVGLCTVYHTVPLS